jgi:hypothetical protein
VRGRLEEKAEWLVAAAIACTETYAVAENTDVSNIDPWTSWNVCRDVGTSLLEEDVEQTMDRLIGLMVCIASEVLDFDIVPPGHDPDAWAKGYGIPATPEN